MTRSEILAEYQTKPYKAGTSEKSVELYISSPGKFEGEPVFAPYFYDVLMNGDGEEERENAWYIDVQPEDVVEFPELEGIARILIQESCTGFVYVTAIPRGESI